MKDISGLLIYSIVLSVFCGLAYILFRVKGLKIPKDKMKRGNYFYDLIQIGTLLLFLFIIVILIIEKFRNSS
ncbi:MAG TPA: hypothetical protein DEP28_02955 [Bacteroidetes bacterium]|nr:hypothetical protein [Bacteroidota bacterium]HCN37040.1 hypothetical protein [Bacteroidota bacterium]